MSKPPIPGLPEGRILADFLQGASLWSIAAKYDVSPSMIEDIIRKYANWRQSEEEE